MNAEKQIHRNGLEIAIIGMAGSFPGARNIEEFWQLLKEGREAVELLTEEELQELGLADSLTQHEDFVPAKGGVMADKEFFDSHFFNYTPTEAAMLDVQTRLLHQGVWEALEDAGYNPDEYPAYIGLFAGATSSFKWQTLKYFSQTQAEVGEYASMYMSDKDFLPTLISYKLNLRGPSVSVNTACSTSLVGVHLACQSLLNGECEMAIAAAVSVPPVPSHGYLYQEGMIQSKDGRCRAFDAQANGTARGEGLGVVVLKLLEDAIRDKDNIHAIIKGTAINNDGQLKAGFTAPSENGQANVIRLAQQIAEVDPHDITYIETHGTGTLIGDPIEINGLTKAFDTDQRHYCAIGSVKPNIGHLDAAAGMAGLIKTVLALKHKQIPPSINFQTPNPKINFEASPFYVNQSLTKWEVDKKARIAGVSSFGIGGTNAHIVLEEHAEEVSHNPEADRVEVLAWSGRTKGALHQSAIRLRDFLQQYPDISPAELAYTMQVGRKAFEFRQSIPFRTISGAIQQLSDFIENPPPSPKIKSGKSPKLIFMFSGQGSQYVNMAKDLYATQAVFRTEMDRCRSILRQQAGEAYWTQLYPEAGADSQIHQTNYTQPLLFAVEYALAQQLMAWGVTPSAMIGHSIGEYVAATLAGVFSLEDGLRIVAERGKLMAQAKTGTMLSVPLSEAELAQMLPSDISLAVINNSQQSVVAGTDEAIQTFANQLKDQGIDSRVLHTSHAFHSHMMEEVEEPYVRFLSGVELKQPTFPFISNVSGTWITPEEAMSPTYWANHLRSTVRFKEGLACLLEEQESVLIEVGPGKALYSFAQTHEQKSAEHRVIHMLRHPKKEVADDVFLMGQIGKLWQWGVEIDWKQLHKTSPNRISLPTYPFLQTSFALPVRSWQEAEQQFFDQQQLRRKGRMEQWFYTPSWERYIPSPSTSSQTAQRYLIFSDQLGVGEAIAQHLQQLGKTVDSVLVGASHEQVEQHLHRINPSSFESYVQLFQKLKDQGALPQKIVYSWNLSSTEKDLGVYSLLFIAKAIGELAIQAEMEVEVISANLCAVMGTELLNPAHALLMGPVKVIPLEYLNIQCRNIDIELEEQFQPERLSKLASTLVQTIVEVPIETGKPQLALRGNHLWQQVFRQLPQMENTDARDIFQDQKVYLLTGGFGGMGSAIAQFLAKEYQAKLILLGRTALPDRESWSNGNEQDSSTLSRIRLITTLEEYGSEVRFFAADVSDHTQMEAVIQAARQQFGNIDCVIHTAGLADFGGLIQERELDSFDQVLAPKVEGTRILDALIPEKNLFLLFSSIGNQLYPIKFGEVAYVSANEYLDAYAQARNGMNADCKVIAINWADWEEVGMSVEAGKRKAEKYGSQASHDSFISTYSLSTKEGVEVFQMAAQQTLPQWVISTVDLAELRAWIWSIRSNVEVDTEVGNSLGKEGHGVDRPELSTAYKEASSSSEKELVSLFRRFFGYQQVGVNDDFFELGGDSLKATTFISLLHKELGVKVPLDTIFKHSSPAELAKLLDKTQKDQYTPIGKAPDLAHYPVNSAQERLYFLQQLHPDSTQYNNTLVFELREGISLENIQTIFETLIQRHEGFRTSFGTENGQLVQWIHSLTDWRITQASLTDESLDAQLQSMVRPFDLSQAPILRVKVVQSPGKKARYLFIDTHHIIVDGSSYDLLVKEFYRLLAGEALPPMDLQFRDYTHWLHQEAQQLALEEQEAFWTAQFSDLPSKPKLPLDYPQDRDQVSIGKRHPFALDADLSKQIQQLATSTSVTEFMILLAALNILVYKLSNQPEFVIGSPIAGRKRAELKQVVGMFVNTLPIRTKLAPDTPFSAYLQKLKEGLVQAFDNQDYPLERLLGQVANAYEPHQHPLFDIVFALQNRETDFAESASTFGSPEIQTIAINKQQIPFDLSLELHKTSEGYQGGWEYNSRIFAAETLQRCTEYYLQILTSVVAKPSVLLQEIQIVPEEEKQKLLFTFNDRSTSYPAQKTIVELFEEQVAERPNAVALICEEASWTYLDLHKRSTQFAHYLRAQGVENATLVGISLERSCELIIGILGILKSGGVYVPIDPKYPKDRINYMLQDSHCVCFIGKEGWARFEQSSENYSEEPLPIAVGPQSLAYIMYTSGTTGRPKGSMVSHQNVVSLVRGVEYVSLTDQDTILSTGSPSFDACTWEYWGSLLNGGTLVMAREETLLDTELLKAEMLAHRVSKMWVTVGWFNQLVDTEISLFAPLSTLLIGGDKLSPPHVKKVREAYPTLQIVNGYGPTENTTFSVTHEIEKVDQDIPIGKPLNNRYAYVLDTAMKVCPVQVVGELYLGGDGLSQGYLNNPSLTSAKFVPDPYREGKYIYRTGDLACWTAEGTILFKGRADNQVKIRGYRVEPAEVERVLMQTDGIKNCVVTVGEDPLANKVLIAYIQVEMEMQQEKLRADLLTKLPHYMIPTFWVEMDMLPLNKNGKVDRRALPEPDYSVQETAGYLAPTDEMEQELLSIWEELLGRSGMGIQENFFEIGGHSLKATLLVSEIHKRFSVRLPLKTIFSATSIQAQAQAIRKAQRSDFQMIQAVEPADSYPLSPMQDRLFATHQMYSSQTAYNISAVYRVEGIFDLKRVEHAFLQLIQRHESLRTTFRIEAGTPRQFIHERMAFQVEQYEGREDQVEAIVQEFVRPFDLAKGPLFRVGILQLSETLQYLLLDMHHIISDGISMDIFASEFIQFYQDETWQPDPLRIQYKDVVMWQRSAQGEKQIQEQAKFWQAKFAKEVSPLALPIDFPRKGRMSLEGATYHFEIEPEMSLQLNKLMAKEGVTPFMFLLTTLHLLLAKLSGQEDLVIGTNLAGRRHADLKGIIGLFIQVLALRNQAPARDSFLEVLQTVKQTTLEAYANQEYPFDQLVQQVVKKRDWRRNPLFDVYFYLDNLESKPIELPGLRFVPYAFERQTTQYDLMLGITEHSDHYTCSFIYSRQLFKAETIQQFADYFLQMLQRILENPSQTIGEIRLGQPAAVQELFTSFN